MATGRLFKRGVSLSLTKISEQKADEFFPEATVRDTTTITDLRIAFNIEKSLGKQPNMCEVTVWNLAETARALLQTKPLTVRLEAGYDGALHRMFQGDVRWCESRHEDVDWESKLQIADGDRAFRYARVSRSYRGGVRVRTVLEEAAAAMGLTLPSAVLANPLIDTQYVNGIVLNGRAQIELSRILTPLGLNWSIQDGRLQILNENTARPEDSIPVSQDTGMIGVPEFGVPTSRKAKPIMTVKVLLNPQITPGCKLEVNSRSINGTFKTKSVRHEGDTHGEAWFTTCECEAFA